MNPQTSITPPTEPTLQPEVPLTPVNPTPKKLSKGIIALIIAGSLLFLGGLIGGGILVAQAFSKAVDTTTSKATPANSTNISGTEVTLEGRTVSAACYTFQTPDDYILSPNAKNCQSEIRLSAGMATGASLTSITVKAQSGQNDLDYFFNTLANTAKQTGTTLSESKEVNIDGVTSGYVAYKDANGISQSVYFVPDTSAKFAYDGKPVTSYLISGPTVGGLLDTVIDSFMIK